MELNSEFPADEGDQDSGRSYLVEQAGVSGMWAVRVFRWRPSCHFSAESAPLAGAHDREHSGGGCQPSHPHGRCAIGTMRHGGVEVMPRRLGIGLGAEPRYRGLHLVILACLGSGGRGDGSVLKALCYEVLSQSVFLPLRMALDTEVASLPEFTRWVLLNVAQPQRDTS